MSAKKPEMQPPEALSFILHQDNLMWSRIQIMHAVQFAGLAAAYAVDDKAAVSIAILIVTATLTLLAFCLLRRDRIIQGELLDLHPQFGWSSPRKWHTPLKGSEVAWAYVVLLLAADACLGFAVTGKWPGPL